MARLPSSFAATQSVQWAGAPSRSPGDDRPHVDREAHLDHPQLDLSAIDFATAALRAWIAREQLAQLDHRLLHGRYGGDTSARKCSGEPGKNRYSLLRTRESTRAVKFTRGMTRW